MEEHEKIYFDKEDIIKAFNYIEKYGAPEGFKLKGQDYDIRYNGLEYCVKALFKVIAGNRIGNFGSTPGLRARFNIPPDIIVIDKRKPQKETPVRTKNKSFIEKRNKKMPHKTFEEFVNKNFYSLKAEELLNKFIEYDTKYDDNIGVYAIYLKGNSLIESLSCKNHIEKRFTTLNKETNKIYNNLFYIGVTDNCFKERLINGHSKGGSTSFTRNLLSALTKKEVKKNTYAKIKKDFFESITWENWFSKYFEYKILPLDKKSTAEFVEALLIYAYQPPFNSKGCDSSPF